MREIDMVAWDEGLVWRTAKGLVDQHGFEPVEAFRAAWLFFGQGAIEVSESEIVARLDGVEQAVEVSKAAAKEINYNNYMRRYDRQ